MTSTGSARLLAAAAAALAVLFAITAPASAAIEFKPLTAFHSGRASIQKTLAGDFNADGRQDLAVLSQFGFGHHWQMFRGNGDGTFTQTPADWSAQSSQQTISDAAAADVNGDGATDLIALQADHMSVLVEPSVWFMSTDGGPVNPVNTVRGGTRPGLEGRLAVGRFYNDSPGADVAVNDRDGNLDVYDGAWLNQDGHNPRDSFQHDAVAPGLAPGPLAVYDADSDGDDDLLAPHTQTQPVVLANNAGGGLQAPAISSVTPLGSSTAAASGDFDADGRTDVAMAASAAGLPSLVFHLTDGSLSAHGSLPADPVELTVGDFDGDHRDDVYARTVSPAGFFLDPDTPLTLRPAAVASATAADFDGDGRDDLVYASGSALGSIGVLVSDSDNYDGPQLTAPAPAIGNDTTPTVAFAAGGGPNDYRCRLDGGAWTQPCPSPYVTPPLTDGPHAIELQHRDPGRTFWSRSTTAPFAIDTAAPAAPTLTVQPGGRSRRAEFTGEPGATFACSPDGGASWEPCAGAYEPALADGQRTYLIRQADQAGNTGPAAAVTFTLDQTGPAAPVMLAAPAASTSERTAQFEFAGEPDGGYECAIDGGAWAPCASPAVYPGLALGAHTFTVRQLDTAGNIGQAASTAFTVAEPGSPVNPDPEPARRVSVVAAPAVTLTGSRLTVACRPDQGTLAACTVTAYVRLRGALVEVGNARADTSGVARVKLTRRGLRLVTRLGGVGVLLRVRAVNSAGSALASSLRVRVLPQRVRLVVATDGLFASGQSTPLTAGQRYALRVARQLDGAKVVVCVGHTDSIGSRASNQRLGLARAQAVCELLRPAGVKVNQRASSRGETQPRAGNGTRSGRALNRRVELTVRY